MKQKYTIYKLILAVLALVVVFGAPRIAHTPGYQANSDTPEAIIEQPGSPLPNPVSSVNRHVPAQAKQTYAKDKLRDSGDQKRYYLLNTPNDYNSGSDWWLNVIDAPAAWSITTGSTNVVVADIDSGFALDHQDLVDNWYYNAAEYGAGKESDGIDNDNNGLIDDYRGWDFFTGDNDPQAGVLNPAGDGIGHGSETAGLVGSVGDNSLGGTAVSQRVSIMPLQVINDNNSGYSDDVASAIYYAVDQGADVINMSLGTSGDDPTVGAAVDYAFANNVVVVAAAGNCGNAGADGPCSGQSQGYVTFPARYDRVIAVGATSINNTRASFSSYGERLDVVAPGSGSISSPTWTNGNSTSAYKSSLYGTSYASPIVSSTVALIRSIRPSSSVDDIRALIMASANKVSGLDGAVYTASYGHGLLDVSKAIKIGNDLQNDGEVVPELLQAGGAASEGSYASSEPIGSGCVGANGSWCSVWLRNDASSYERFLPYAKIGASGKAGWSFNSAALNRGSWEIRARSGSTVSDTPYYLFRK